jgi:NAD-dependent deacetylase
LSGAMLRQRPELCWKYMRQIGDACRGAGPNEGHQVLARLQDHFQQLVILTQNVDGFHLQAGSRDVIEIHGNLGSLHCTRCAWRLGDDEDFTLTTIPRCPSCDAVVRPQVVLFGELLPERALRQLDQQLDAGFDAVLSVGTTSVFPYIAAPVLRAHRQGRPTVEINPGNTQVSDVVRWRLRAGAAESLLALEQQLTGRVGGSAAT